MSDEAKPQYALIIVMGVSGTGKSTLGTALAHKLDLPYIEGDRLHPRSNIAKMSSGAPLTDQDREPWLQLIRKTAEETIVRKETKVNAQEASRPLVGLVVGCSALKKYYRDILRGKTNPHSSSSTCSEDTDPTSTIPPISPLVLPTYFVFIPGSRSVLLRRLEDRQGHFMKADMLDSQLATLENPDGEEHVVEVPLEAETGKQVSEAVEGLRKEGLPV